MIRYIIGMSMYVSTLGGNWWDRFAQYGIDVEAGFNYLTNPYEKNLARDPYITKSINSGSIPQASFLGNYDDGSKAWNFTGEQLEAFGLDPEQYKVKIWFYPIQTFFKIFNELKPNYPDTGLEAFIAICYYNWLAKYAEPSDELDALIYSVKLNSLKEFINGIGYSGAWKKAESEINRKAAAAQAAAQAAAAARVYAQAEAEKAAEAEKIRSQITTVIEQDLPEQIAEGDINIKNLLMIGVPVVVAIYFISRRKRG